MLIVISLCVLGAALAFTLALIEPIRAVQYEMQNTPRRDGVLGNPVLRSIVSCLARAYEKKPSDFKDKIQLKLRHANYPSGITSAAEFIALANLTGAAAALSLLAMLLLLGKISLGGLFFVLIAGGLAILFVHSWLANIVGQRRTNIARQYPYFLDLAVMSMEAGASFTDVIEIYSEDNDALELAEELGWVLKEMQMGNTLRESLSALSGRLASNEIRQSINAIIQGQRMGTPLGQLLREQAESIRFRRSQMAERAAEEIKVKITGPVILMMLSIFILILGPAVINVMDSGIF